MTIARRPTAARYRALLAGTLVVMACVAHLPALRGGFVADDIPNIVQNPTLRSVHGLARIWLEPGAVSQYYPVTYTAFWLEYQLWAESTIGYHAINIGLHALASILVWLVLGRLHPEVAWLTAALFALHPVHVQSVAWISALKNVLSTCFYLAALLAYLRHAERDDHDPARMRDYLMALILFILALLTKTITCSLPGAILLLQWWKRGRLTRREVRPLVPFVAVGAALAALTISMESRLVVPGTISGALGWPERVLRAGRATWFHLSKLAWPTDLQFLYPRWQLDRWQLGQWLFPLGVVSVLAALWLGRRRLGRGPLVAALFFLGTLLPALGLIDMALMYITSASNHLQYLASLGPLTLAAAGLMRLRRVGTLGQLAIILILVQLGSLARDYARIFESGEAIWQHTIAGHESPWALNNLATLRTRQNRVDEAIDLYSRSLAVAPDAAIRAALGGVLASRGRTDEALLLLEAAVRDRPDLPHAHLNLGNVYLTAGDVAQAEASYRRALRLAPTLRQARDPLVRLLLARGALDEAVAVMRDAVRHTGSARDLQWLAQLLDRAGRRDEATASRKRALRAARASGDEELAKVIERKLADAPTP